jgi:RNA polymerase sigma factor (sigma-70 family)
MSTAAAVDVADRNAVLAANLGWVFEVAHRWARTHPAGVKLLGGLDDVRQLAVLVALQSLGSYDPTRGALTTFLRFQVHFRLCNEVHRAKQLAAISFTTLQLANESWEPAAREPVDVDLRLDLDAVRSALRHLPPRMRRILVLRAHGRQLREIGERLGICHERVRQLEAKAVRKVRRLLCVEELQG